MSNRPVGETAEAFKVIRNFVGPAQLRCMVDQCRGEERKYFLDKYRDLGEFLRNMPETYEQDGKGDEAIVSLHYFRGNMDWFIIEKDAGGPDDEEPGKQLQAYGLADLGWGAELGYISIEELGQNGVELDLHWTPKTLGEIKASKGDEA